MATASKKDVAETKAEAAKADAKSAVKNLRASVSERASSVRENVTKRFDDARVTANLTAGAAVDFGKAYYSGLNTLGRTLFGLGQECYGEVTQHAQKTMQAKRLREVATLRAADLQTRVETEMTMKPVIELLDGKRAA